MSSDPSILESRAASRPLVRNYGGLAVGLGAGLAIVAAAVAVGVAGPGVIALETAIFGLAGAVAVTAAVEFVLLYVVPKSLRRELDVAFQHDVRMEKELESTVETIRDDLMARERRVEQAVDDRISASVDDVRTRLQGFDETLSQRLERLESRVLADAEQMADDVRAEMQGLAQTVDEALEAAHQQVMDAQKLAKRLKSVVDHLQVEEAHVREELLIQAEASQQQDAILEDKVRVLEEAVAHESEELEEIFSRLPHEGEPGADVPISELEGIRAAQARQMRKLGVHSIADLRRANPQRLARALKTWPNQVRHWQAMAELMRIDGVGPHYAEVLDAAGFHDVHELGHAEPEIVTQRIEELRIKDAPLLGDQAIGAERVKAWIREARRIEETHQA